MKHVGQVGVGAVGQHFARHLLSHYGALVVYDKDPTRTDGLRSLDATVAESLESLAAQCDTIVLSLPNSFAVRQVLAEKGGLLETAAENTLVIDCSTVGPDTSRWAARECSLRKLRYVEAPVTSAAPGAGGTDGAEAGNMTFLVGGDESAVESAGELLHVLGDRYIHLGPVGSGSIMKLVTNHISGITTLAIAEGLVLAAAAGFPAADAMEVIKCSVADSYVLDNIMQPRLTTANYEGGFAVDLMHKDHLLAGELGKELTVPLPLNQLAAELFQMMRAQGLGSSDHAVCAQFLADLAQVDLKRGRKEPDS